MNEGGIRHNRLFLKVYANYAIMVILFAVMLGTIFMQLIQKATTENFEDKLLVEANRISKRFTQYIIDENYDECLTFINFLIEVYAEEVWSISKSDAVKPMDSRMESVDLSDVELSDDYINVINEAFNGRESSVLTFSEIHGSTVLVIGVPVNGANGEVCGAILLSSRIDAQQESVANSMKLILLSSSAALILSFFISFIFAKQLTGPILKMRMTALALADGKYETKTNINRNDEIGDLAYTIDFLTDKLMENEKVRKNLEQMRMDFFANVSHELRTPITVVKAYTESLVDGVITDDQKRQQYYEKMLSECKSMERLVGDLLILSKMQNPDFEVETEPVNLIQIFDELNRTVSTIGEEKDIHIEMNKDQDSYMMLGDYDRLRQMFLVILDNAVKFSPEHSAIHINISQTDKIKISIRDEGIGITKEELPSIFEKFYKSKLRQNAKGSGLGLAIAKQIALKHKGTIEVKSEVGIGTEFIFTFHPLTQEEFQQMRES